MIGPMPGFGDYIFLFVLALILFGPKKMPELARQLGKLMAEFRKASNEFKMQMEEEMRTSDRAEQERRIAALEAAAAAPAAEPGSPISGVPEIPTDPAAPVIATVGELTMRPPETGVPVAADAVSALAESVPAARISETSGPKIQEEQTHG
jgi:sec-independent protein translocase protein TatB